MSDTLVNIRVRHLHFKLYKDFRFRIEPNNFWEHYYSFKNSERKDYPFIEVYKFFTWP